MNILQSIILGAVEGITEFLPISSTAHLIITSKLLGLPQSEFIKFFEVFIQSGAILAVTFLYLKYVLKHKDVIWKVLFSFVPTAIVGFFLHEVIKNIFFESDYLIIFAMGFVGLVFIIIEGLIKRDKLKITKAISSINWTTAVLIGFAQSLAVVPGVSRAGIVIVAMMLLGYKREEAATYSFLLAVPTIFAAGALDLIKVDSSLLSQAGIANVVVGFGTAFITAYFSVQWLVSYLKKNSLAAFGIYRIALAIILLLFLR